MLVQVYGVCRGPVDQAGSIKVISPARRVDTLMSTDADFEGITGLWSLPAEPGGDSHVLVVLSFLAGSRALTAGTTFSDVTDSVGLCPHETTIFSACIAPAIIVQVTPRRIQLCNISGLAASASAADDEDFDVPLGRSRARYDSSLSLAGLDISPPDVDSTGTSEQRSPMDLWTPTSGASISAAVAGDGLLIACCSDFKGLMALTAAELGTQSPPGSGHLAGKRKRQQRHWQLHLAECPHLLVGLRSGTLIQLQADHAHTGTLQSLARLSLDQEQQDLMEDGSEGLRSPSLALSDGLSLLGQHAGSGRVLCRLLAVRGVQHVAPLWQPASTMQSSANSRFTLLCSLEGGRLQLVDVQPPGHPHIRTLPLSVQPTKVVSYRHSGLVQESSLPLLLVLGSQRGRCEAKDSAPLQCLLGVHPTTGDEQLRLTSVFEPGEVPTCICTWQPHLELPTAFVKLRLRLAGPVAQLVERVQSQGGGQAAHLDLPPALRQLVRQMAEEVAGIPAEVLESSTLVAVGTSMHAGEAAKSGRLQLLRLRPYCSEVGGQRTTAWDVEVAHVLNFPDPVHAVAQHGDLSLVATVGRRLVRFEPLLLKQQGREQTWSPRGLVGKGGLAEDEVGDEEPSSSCSMLPSAMTVLKVNLSGFSLTADEHTSVVMCEGERQKPVASSLHSASVMDCTFSAAPGGNAAGSAVFAGGAAYGEELPGVAAVTADGTLVVLTKPALGAAWSPESNLTAVLRWSLHEPGVLVQAGSLQKPIAGIGTDQYSAVCRWLWHRAGQTLEQLHALGLCGEQGNPRAVSASEQSQGASAGPKQAHGQALAHLLRLRQLLCEDDAASAHARQLGPHNAPGSMQSLTAVTQGGALVECKRLSSAQHALLLAVQQAAVKASELRPLGGLGLAQEQAPHAPEALEALDGDYLEQVLDLAATELSELVHDAAHVQPAEAHSLDEVITLLQGVL
eukprot:jgi/Astpho2/4288/Aster-05235